MDEVIISQDDVGKVFDLMLGGIVVLGLPETPTTGYRWKVSADDGLELTSTSYSPSPTSAIGGGGSRTFRFRAVYPGTHCIEAKLWRQWIGESSTIDRCSFTIIVKSV